MENLIQASGNILTNGMSKTGCTQFKKLDAQYSYSKSTYPLKSLEKVAARAEPNKVYAKFLDEASQKLICEGELHSCVPVVKDFYSEQNAVVAYGVHGSHFQLVQESGVFEFDCA